MKLIYKPFSIIAGIVAGMLSRKLFDAIWSRFRDDPAPKADTEAATFGAVIVAAAVQGVTARVTRAAVDRASARGFKHLTGIWPGEKADAEPS